MREGWELKTLSEVCEKITDGSHNPPKGKESGRIMLSGRNITESGLDLTKVRYISNDEFEKEDKRTDVKPGDVLLTIVGTIGRSVVYPSGIEKMAFQRSVAILKPNEILDSDFLSKLFNSKEYQDLFESKARGVAQKGIYLKTLRSIPIPIPPLEEQQQIVAILDQAFAAIDQAKANIEQNIENAKELFQSKLNQIFSQTGDGWEEKILGEVCELSMGQSPKGTSYNSEGIGTPLINGPVEFGNEPFSKTIMSKWTTEPTKMCKEGDLILCVRGSTTGRINISGFDACIGRGVASIRYEKNQDWINFFIRCNQKNIYDLGTGSTFPNVSGKILSELKFSEPKSIEVQMNLIGTMKQLEIDINKIVKKYKQKLFSLDELKKSILQKAFAGELTEKEIAI